LANHKSALKRIRQNVKRNERNKGFRTLVKTVTKKVTAEAEAGNKEQALIELKRAEKVIAKVGCCNLGRKYRAGCSHSLLGMSNPTR